MCHDSKRTYCCSSFLHCASSLWNNRPRQVPLSKLDRVKNIARSSLVTLPKFAQDQAKYKAMLRQIGRLNGILPEDVHPEAALKQATRRRRKSLSPRKRRTKTKTKLRVASTGKEGAEGALSAQNQEHTGGPTNEKTASATIGHNFPGQAGAPSAPSAATSSSSIGSENNRLGHHPGNSSPSFGFSPSIVQRGGIQQREWHHPFHRQS